MPPVISAEMKRVKPPSTKPKRGPVDPAGQDEQEEDRLEAGHARARDAQRGAAGGQDAEQGDGLGVEPCLARARPRTAASSSGTTARRTHGASAGVRRRRWRRAPRTKKGQSRARPARPPRRAPAGAPSAAPDARSAGGEPRLPFTARPPTSSTVRKVRGLSTLATWGAKTGDWQTTSRAGPSAISSPWASTSARSATAPPARRHGWPSRWRSPSSPQPLEHARPAGLGRVVEAAGRARRAGAAPGRGARTTPSARESRWPSERSCGCSVPSGSSASDRHDRRRGARRRDRARSSAVRALRRHALGVEQVPGSWGT